jgi:hypothetical protein
MESGASAETYTSPGLDPADWNFDSLVELPFGEWIPLTTAPFPTDGSVHSQTKIGFAVDFAFGSTSSGANIVGTIYFDNISIQ